MDLNEFYAYADSNPYDGYDREDIKKYKNRLSRSDYNLLVDENPYDNINRDDFNDIDDFYCSTKGEYDQFADQNKYDRFTDDNYYQLRGFRNKNSYDNYRDEYRYSRRPPISYEESVLAGWRYDGSGGVASWYR